MFRRSHHHVLRNIPVVRIHPSCLRCQPQPLFAFAQYLLGMLTLCDVDRYSEQSLWFTIRRVVVTPSCSQPANCPVSPDNTKLSVKVLFFLSSCCDCRKKTFRGRPHVRDPKIPDAILRSHR